MLNSARADVQSLKLANATVAPAADLNDRRLEAGPVTGAALHRGRQGGLGDHAQALEHARQAQTIAEEIGFERLAGHARAIVRGLT